MGVLAEKSVRRAIGVVRSGGTGPRTRSGDAERCSSNGCTSRPTQGPTEKGRATGSSPVAYPTSPSRPYPGTLALRLLDD